MAMAPSFIAAAGHLLGAISSVNAGNAEKKRMRMVADQANSEASINAQGAMTDAARAEAAGFTQAADAGGGFTGSAVAALNDFASTALFNARALIYRGQTEAADAIYRGEVAQKQGYANAIQQAFQAGNSLMGGYAQARNQKMMAAGS